MTVAALAVASLGDALASPPGPVTGLRVAGSGLILVVAITLAGRVLVAVDRALTAAAPRDRLDG